MQDHIDLMMLVKTALAAIVVDLSIWEKFDFGSILGIAWIAFMMLFFNTLFSTFFLMPMVRMWERLKKYLIDKGVVNSDWYYKNRK